METLRVIQATILRHTILVLTVAFTTIAYSSECEKAVNPNQSAKTILRLEIVPHSHENFSEKIGISTRELQALRQFAKFIRKNFEFSPEDLRRLNYIVLRGEDLPEFSQEFRLVLTALNEGNRLLPGKSSSTPESILSGYIRRMYDELLQSRLAYLSRILLDHSYGTNDLPTLKQITEWMLMDLESDIPRFQFRLFIYLSLGVVAEFSPNEDSPLNRISSEHYLLIDHPKVHEWLNDKENFDWLFGRHAQDFLSNLKPQVVEEIKRIAVSIAVNLSRAKGGLAIAKRLFSFPLLRGDDAHLVDEWIKMQEQKQFPESSFDILARIRLSLAIQQTSVTLATFCAGYSALPNTVINSLREHALRRLPNTTEDEREHQTMMWLASAEFAADPANDYLAYDAINDAHQRLAHFAAISAMNNAIYNKTGIKIENLFKLLKLAPEALESSSITEVILRSVSIQDFPTILTNRTELGRSLFNRYLNKISADLKQPLSRGEIAVTNDQEEVLIANAFDETQVNSDVELFSILILAQLPTLQTTNIGSILKWINQQGGKRSRLVQLIRQTLHHNIGMDKIFSTLSSSKSTAEISRFLRDNSELLDDKDNARLLLHNLLRVAHEIPDSSRSDFLALIDRVISAVNLWPEYIDILTSKDGTTLSYEDYVIAGAVYASQTTGSLGLRNDRIRSIFVAGAQQQNPYCPISILRVKIQPPKAITKTEVVQKVESKAPQAKREKPPVPVTPPKRHETTVANVDIVEQAKSGNELLKIIKDTKSAKVALSAVEKLIERNNLNRPLDFATPEEFKDLINTARTQITATKHYDVSKRLFALIQIIVEQQYLFELDDEQFADWEKYTRDFMNRFSFDVDTAELFIRWMTSVSEEKILRVYTVLASPLTKKMKALPDEQYFAVVSVWYQALEKNRNDFITASFAAILASNAMFTNDIFETTMRGAFFARDVANRTDLFDFLKTNIEKRKASRQSFYHDAIRFSAGLFEIEKLKNEKDVAQRLAFLNITVHRFYDSPQLDKMYEIKLRNEERSLLSLLIYELNRGRMAWLLSEQEAKSQGFNLLSLDPLTGRSRKIILKAGYKDSSLLDLTPNEWKTVKTRTQDIDKDVFIYMFDTIKDQDTQRIATSIKLYGNAEPADFKIDPTCSIPVADLLRYSVLE